jgi:hypothetical protein
MITQIFPNHVYTDALGSHRESDKFKGKNQIAGFKSALF